MIRAALERLAALLPAPRVLLDRAGVSPYLSRWYLVGRPTMPDGSSPWEADGAPRRGLVMREGLGLYLHKFHRGDDDQELHNHPWRWAVSLVLAGGYREERRLEDGRVVWRDVLPGTLNAIGQNDFHRVELLEHDAWTLFVAGPRVSSWSFWNRLTGEVTPWRAFIERRRTEAAALR